MLLYCTPIVIIEVEMNINLSISNITLSKYVKKYYVYTHKYLLIVLELVQSPAELKSHNYRTTQTYPASNSISHLY